MKQEIRLTAPPWKLLKKNTIFPFCLEEPWFFSGPPKIFGVWKVASNCKGTKREQKEIMGDLDKLLHFLKIPTRHVAGYGQKSQSATVTV